MSALTTYDVISFKDRATTDLAKPHSDLLVIELTIQDIDVARVLVDTGCSANIIFKSTLERMEIDLRAIAEDPKPLFGLSGDATMTHGSISLLVRAWSIVKITEFLVVHRPTSYNAIVGTIVLLGAPPSSSTSSELGTKTPSLPSPTSSSPPSTAPSPPTSSTTPSPLSAIRLCPTRSSEHGGSHQLFLTRRQPGFFRIQGQGLITFEQLDFT
ncbi:hypothetical protein Bca4012_063409 [Brassica carinata]